MSRRGSLGRVSVTTLKIGALSLVAVLALRFGSEGGYSAVQPTVTRVVPQTASLCPGDSNLDGLRDVRDLVLIQSVILNQRTLGGQALANADANQDAQIDVRDIVALLQHQLGMAALAACEISFPDEPPSIRFIAPGTGPERTPFTVIGRGFSPIAGLNTILFSRSGEILQATLIAASETALRGTVPEGAESDLYRVTVTVGGIESNGGGFQVRTTPPRLELLPSSSTILMPPGSGRETLVIGGGTPPYVLKPLPEGDESILQAELKDSVIEVTGLELGVTTLEVEDSSETPATDQASVVVREPHFNPTFEVVPHSLLAGASPGFSFLIHHEANQIQVFEGSIGLDKGSLDLESLQPGSTVALANNIVFRTPRDFQAFNVSEVISPGKVLFEAAKVEEGTFEITAEGSLESGSALLTLRHLPTPPPESLGQVTSDQQILLDHQLIQLPQAAGESFDITATFTSVSVRDDDDVPLTKSQTRTFTTMAPPPGAPRLEQLRPVVGPIGQLLTITGSGFDPEPQNNIITFLAENFTRVEGLVESASTNELMARVPQEAVSGPVRVAVNGLESNDYQYFVLFRPSAGIFFAELLAGQPAAPLLLLGQADRFRTAVTDHDVRLASLKVTLDAGGIRTDDLIKDQPAGTAQSSLRGIFGSTTKYLLVYGGQEEGGEARHLFDLKKTLEGDSEGTLHLSESESGGVLFELVPDFTLAGFTLEVRLEAEVYVAPESVGTFINIRSEVRSVKWNFFPNSEMVVVFPDRVRTK